ncbi:Ankyrin repeat-containing protein [Apiospora phragmitis]|uniref:Ankyrin repeat-containing protein n=1 Tax=Apiospora phragmitis TaxID=2905665 RepID=A0ABR1VZF6_9PEZI
MHFFPFVPVSPGVALNAEVVGTVASGISIAELAGQVVAAGLKIKILLGEIKNVSGELQDLHGYLDLIHLLGLQLQDIKHNPVNPNSPLQSAILRCNAAATSLRTLVEDLSAQVQKRGFRGKLRAVLHKDKIKSMKECLISDVVLLSYAHQVALQQALPDVIVARIVEKLSPQLEHAIVTQVGSGALLPNVNQHKLATTCSTYYTQIRIPHLIEFTRQVTVISGSRPPATPDGGRCRPFQPPQWRFPSWLSSAIKLILDCSQWGWKYHVRNITRFSIHSEMYGIVWGIMQKDSLQQFRKLVEGRTVSVHDRFYIPPMHDSNDWLRENSMVTEIVNDLTTHNVEFHGLANVGPWNNNSESFNMIQKALQHHAHNMHVLSVCLAAFNGDYQGFVPLMRSLRSECVFDDSTSSIPWRAYIALNIVGRSIMSQTESTSCIVRYLLSQEGSNEIILKGGLQLPPESGVPENTVSLLIFQLAVALVASVLVYPDNYDIGWSDLLRDVLSSILLESSTGGRDASPTQKHVFETLPLSDIVAQLHCYVPWTVTTVEWEVAVQVLLQTLFTCSVDLTEYDSHLKNSRFEILSKEEDTPNQPRCRPLSWIDGLHNVQKDALVYGPRAETGKSGYRNLRTCS